MRFDADALGLSPTGNELLRALIEERTGLYYDDTRRNMLLDRLAPLVIGRGFDSFLDYYYLLRYGPGAEEEWDRVFDSLGVPETYFWRQADQIKAVVDILVPDLVRQRGAVRIWSVPCSSGEEPLSIAMAVAETGWFGRAPIEIVGSDASPTAIEKARRGLYRERSMRQLPPELREKYFAREGDDWRVDPALHRRVTWNVVNIMDRSEAGFWACSPIVFCRNLLIYFSPDALKRTVSMFAELMPTPGYLCLGSAESLLRHTTVFRLEEYGGAYVYVKQ